jgi:hypothetical protein
MLVCRAVPRRLHIGGKSVDDNAQTLTLRCLERDTKRSLVSLRILSYGASGIDQRLQYEIEERPAGREAS